MKRIILLLLLCAMLLHLCACGVSEVSATVAPEPVSPVSTAEPTPKPTPTPTPTPEPTPEPVTYDFIYDALPEEIFKAVPEEERGTVDEWEYGQVYYPAHYDNTKQYNVLFLLSGFDGNPTTWFERKKYEDLHAGDIIDAMVYLGYAEPILILTYQHPGYTYSPKVNSSMFVNDILPATVEAFPTYAKSSNREDLIAARDHFAMAGFSNGSFYTVMSGLGTWTLFENTYTLLDYVSWFGAFAGFRSPEQCQYVEEDPLGAHKVNFIIWEVGTYDQNGNQDVFRLRYPLWCETGIVNDGENSQVIFYEKMGHNDRVALMSLYNALLVFFRIYELNGSSVTIHGAI